MIIQDFQCWIPTPLCNSVDSFKFLDVLLQTNRLSVDAMKIPVQNLSLNMLLYCIRGKKHKGINKKECGIWTHEIITEHSKQDL